VGDLVTVRQVGRYERRVRAGTVACETPLLYAVDSPPDQRLFGVRFAFDLTLPRRNSCVAVFVRMRFDDPRTTAVVMETEGEQAVTAEGLQEHRIGWFFGGFDQRTDLGSRHVIKAVLKAPADLETVTGTVRVDASILRGRLRTRIDHATMRDPVMLALRPTGIRPTSAVRLCVAADIERFSRFRTPEAALVHKRFVEVMVEAREHAGIDAAEVSLQRAGDGQTAYFPPAIDETQVIPLLVEGLATALAQANADRAADGRIRIRVAMDRGHVGWEANGWVGDPAIAVHRLIDSAVAHQALVDNPDSDFMLIVSDVIYRDVIAHGYRNLLPGAFRLVHVDIPAKNFTELAWVYLPSGPD
jgi:hypothetical protein